MKTAVIGLGVGAHHLRVYAEHPLCEPVYACDFDSAKTAWAKQMVPNIICTNDDTLVTSSSDLDVISIASFDDDHYQQTVAALDSGINVIVEKPICLNKHEMVEIKKALSRNPQNHLTSNLPLRTCPRFGNVKKSIQAGEFGRVYHIEGDYYWGRPAKLMAGWRPKMDFYSIILGAAIHMVDLIMWITDKRPVSVTCFGNRIALDNSELRFNDFALLQLQFGDGSTAKVTAHGGCMHPHFHALKVFGSKKTFVNDYVSAYELNSQSPNSLPKLDPFEYPAKKNRSELIHSFIDYLHGKRMKPLVTHEEVFDVMSVCLAAERSLNTWTKQSIEYL